MKVFTRAALVVVSLLLSAGLAVSADNVKKEVKVPVIAAKESAGGKVVDAKGAAKAKLIDINSATETELKAVAGIGDAYAAKIIAGRPYANKAQLKSRKVLPAILYEQVKEQLIAKQPQK